MSGLVTGRGPRPHTRRPAGPLNVARWGAGERVVCVHGSLSWGEFAFRMQRPLAHSHERVVSGRWDNLASGEAAVGHAAIGAVCDTLTHALDARRVTIDGWAHGCQYSGKPFNDALQSFWSDR